MGARLLELFDRVERENVNLGETRLVLKLGMSKSRAAQVEDSPDLLVKAEQILQEIVATKDLFKK